MYERLGRVAATAATVASCVILCAGAAQAATITVNSLADDVFPNGTGAIFDSNDLPIVLAPPCTLDLDGNGGQPDALTDSLLLMRALSGLTGTAVTNGAVGASATRPNWTAIRNYLNANCGSGFAP